MPRSPSPAPLDNLHRVETPEGVDLLFRPAGLVPRALAFALDLAIRAALLAPGCRSRADALRLAAQRAIRLVAGATLMLLVAAFIEAYWSSMTYVDAPVKYAVGLLLWLLVALYLGRSGGSRHAAE